VGIVATFVYTAVISYVLLKLIDKLIGLRVDKDTETEGLDIREHDERGYII